MLKLAGYSCATVSGSGSAARLAMWPNGPSVGLGRGRGTGVRRGVASAGRRALMLRGVQQEGPGGHRGEQDRAHAEDRAGRPPSPGRPPRRRPAAPRPGPAARDPPRAAARAAVRDPAGREPGASGTLSGCSGPPAAPAAPAAPAPPAPRAPGAGRPGPGGRPRRGRPAAGSTRRTAPAGRAAPAVPARAGSPGPAPCRWLCLVPRGRRPGWVRSRSPGCARRPGRLPRPAASAGPGAGCRVRAGRVSRRAGSRCRPDPRLAGGPAAVSPGWRMPRAYRPGRARRT